MYRRSGKSTDRRRGATLVLACVSFTGILFLSALAIDMGNLMAARRHAQNCCDAAALAGCVKVANLLASGTMPTQANAQAAAQTSIDNNNSANHTNYTITVNYPPSSGSFKSNTNSVEVVLTFTQNNLVVSGSNAVTVRSVASCDPPSTPSSPMLILDPTGSKSFWLNSGRLNLSSAPVQVNSNNATAAKVDSGSTANATVRVVGGSSGSFSPAAQTGAAPVPDPYALVPVPSKTGLTTYTTSVYSGNVTLNPGYYPNGLYHISGSGNVTMNPGLYYIEGGNFWINTTGTVTANGVTIYHNGSNSSAQLMQMFGLDVGICLCPTNGNYTFTPPSTGTYAGISFFHNPSYSGEAFYDFWGSGVLTVGLQYFPGSTLRCWSASNGGTINCNELVTKDFKLTGTHEIYGNSYNSGFSKLTWNASRASNRPPTNVFLAE